MDREQSIIEKKEKESRREISFWIFRHGEPDYENDQLTDLGKEQVEQAALDFLK